MISVWDLMFLLTLLFGYIDMLETITAIEILNGVRNMKFEEQNKLLKIFIYYDKDKWKWLRFPGYMAGFFLKLIYIIGLYMLITYVHVYFGLLLALNFVGHFFVIFHNIIHIEKEYKSIVHSERMKKMFTELFKTIDETNDAQIMQNDKTEPDLTKP